MPNKVEHKYKPGDKVGRLTLLSRFLRYTNSGSQACWRYRCECGENGIVRQTNLITGSSRSCGCLHREIVSATKTVHGESDKTPEWIAWMNMISRCENENNPQFKDYGGRGISVCKKWRKSYAAFLLDVGRRPSRFHSLNRKNNNKGYSSANVNWATSRQQNSNRRSNVFLMLGGVKKTVMEWARLHRIKPALVYKRLKRGWSVEESLSTPSGTRLRGILS